MADTLRYNGSIWFPRRISSVTFDNNNRALLTFEGHENESDFANLLVVNNADGAYSFVDKSTSGKKAAYSALVEATTGDVFVGTEDGLWKTTASSFNATPAWNIYGDFVGVPITSLVQQTNVFQLQRMTTHDGINVDNYVFPRTKFPYAIYIGTYGRGVFMDSSYVTSYVEEIVDSTDYRVGITPVVNSKGSNTVKVFPNPASVRTTIELTVANAGNAQLRVYDLSGKLVINRSMGRLAEGVHNHVVDCSGLAKGMYLINVLVGNESAATKLLVK